MSSQLALLSKVAGYDSLCFGSSSLVPKGRERSEVTILILAKAAVEVFSMIPTVVNTVIHT